MNIALIGYGKMGKAIEKIAVDRGHQIVAIVDQENTIGNADLSSVDVAIEFTVPAKVIDHIHFLLAKNIPTVVGTTGWNDQLRSITELVKKQNGALLHASNFSVGVNLFFEINKKLAQLMSNHPDYYVSMEEIHHTQKLDAPSGTAITLAEGIIKNHASVSSWNCPQHPTQHEFNGGVEIEAIRKPEVPGTHSVKYASSIDEITISHEAKNRTGFALGAVLAAEWLANNKNGVFTMSDVLNINS